MRSLSDIWPRHDRSARPPRTAFVLSGGAAMGALQVGMLRALIERRILPDVILGCSVGALNGMVLAGSPTLATVGRIQDVWLDLIDRELVPTGLLPSPVQLVRRGESISSNDTLRALISEVVPAETFEDLEVPFECVATNIDAGTEHWFTSGDLVSAVLASASIPSVFPPVEIDGVRYLDGAIVDDVPIQRAVEAGATRIFVLQVGGAGRPRPELRRPLDVAFLAYWIARRHRVHEDLARIPDDVEIVILPHGDPAPVRYNDLSSSAHLMDVAYRASSDQLDARIDGRMPPTFGPILVSDLIAPPPVDDLTGADTTESAPADPGEFERAQRLLAAARRLIGMGTDRDAADEIEADEADLIATQAGLDVEADVRSVDAQELRRRLTERAESIGPAMRALIDRVLERGARPEPADADGASRAPVDTAADQSGEK